jgi:DNA polymerase-3 subunit gamma/tau
MVLIRLAYTADLPPPDEIVKALGGNGAVARPATMLAPAAAQAATAGAPEAAAPVHPAGRDENAEDNGAGVDEGLLLDAEAGPLPVLRSFAEVVELAGTHRDAKLKYHLEERVSLVRFDPSGSIELHLLDGAPKELANELREKLNAWTGKRWVIALSKTPGEKPIGEVERERTAAELKAMQAHPAVAAVLKQFPEARITSIRPLPGAKNDG